MKILVLSDLEVYYFMEKISRYQKYGRTVNGFISIIYSSQKLSSKKRGHNPPSYTKKQLSEWIMSKPKFMILYNTWASSDYDKNLKPSLDRKDDYKGYTLNNIQLTTWYENWRRGQDDMLNGVNKKLNRIVLQYDLNNVFIKEHYSIHQAGRETIADYRNIQMVCGVKRNKAGGFIWKYKN